MLLVGLTGGLACGKTFIGEELERLGCFLIRADTLGHEVMLPGGEAYAQVVDLFGPSILNEDGTVARPRLAELVFNDPAKLAALAGIVHPAVRRREDEIIQRIERDTPDAIVVVEAAILIESGAYRRFDSLLVAACSEEQQRERALHRNPSLTKESIEARLRSQMPTSEKLAFADYVIDTSGTKDNTIRQTQSLYVSLRQNRKRV